MLSPSSCLKTFLKLDIHFFTGVPDSLLKDFCACLTEKVPIGQHVIATNEGSAVGLAIGNHIATKKIPMVYMQNSGLGNAVNPLLSLASQEVYGIPIILMIGWRGEPGVQDEPQHIHQGKITLDMLNTMNIPFVILDRKSVV